MDHFYLYINLPQVSNSESVDCKVEKAKQPIFLFYILEE